MRIAIAAACLLVLSGCASQRLYNWGGYDDALYASYKDPGRTEAMKLQLEKHIALMEGSKQRVAPGLYAELGTLYLQTGSRAEAVTYYRKERDAWPESVQLMDTLIANVERSSKVPGGSK
jgi:hypothetical protein